MRINGWRAYPPGSVGAQAPGTRGTRNHQGNCTPQSGQGAGAADVAWAFWVTGMAREFGVMTSMKHDGNPSLLDPEAPRSKEGAWAAPGRKSDPEGSDEQLMYHEV